MSPLRTLTLSINIGRNLKSNTDSSTPSLMTKPSAILKDTQILQRLSEKTRVSSETIGMTMEDTRRESSSAIRT